jgi:hypothetical protein
VNCARAYCLAQVSRAVWYRKSRAKDQSARRLRIRDLAHAQPRFRYERILSVTTGGLVEQSEAGTPAVSAG